MRPARVAAAACALTAAKLLAYVALAHSDFARAMCQWDCGWYVGIVSNGYDRATHSVQGHIQANWAFFPLYPLLVRCLDLLPRARPEVGGIALSTACFVAFAVLGAAYRARTRPEASAWRWLLLLTVWPYGFYFHATYTEALYAALATAAMLALVHGRPFAAAVAAALLGATRPTGILFAPWIAWRTLTSPSPSREGRGEGSRWIAVVPAIIATAGLAAYMLFLWLRTGGALAFIHIQAGWQHRSSNPARVLWDAFASLSTRHRGLAYDAAWALLGLAAALWLSARGLVMEAWLCGATVLMALASGTVWSMPRFVSANPAFLFAAADLLERVPGRLPKLALLTASAAIELVFVTLWFRGSAFLT